MYCIDNSLRQLIQWRTVKTAHTQNQIEMSRATQKTRWNNLSEHLGNTTNISPHLDHCGMDILAIIVQVVAFFFIISATIMFIKNSTLLKFRNIFQFNILLSTSVLLLVDWSIVDIGPRGCEVYSLVFLSFGTASTLSTLCIAIERYQRMARLTGALPRKRQYTIMTFGIWATSLLVLVSPIYTMLFHDRYQATPFNDVYAGADATNMACFFSNSSLYQNVHSSIIFLLMSVLAPAGLMLFCYIKIFVNVRQVRINRWRNHAAAQCSRQTTVIRTTARKANVFHSQKRQNTFYQSPHTTTKSRERSILSKGIFSVLIILFCWLPFAVLWILISFWGFSTKISLIQRYLTLLAKCSAIFNVAHYVCFNVTFRKMYLKTIFAPCQNWFPFLNNTNSVANASQIESELPPSLFKESIFSTCASGRMILDPIAENNPHDMITMKTRKTRSIRSIPEGNKKHSQHSSHIRTKSLPFKFGLNRKSTVIIPEVHILY